ncbi:DUF6344 domain-containing protein [Streptomyces physcomitrii]|uniref:Uncharacterized protein n=1 Tax=Streptomyces physcomitrii TaxID=2724184 RepID=A0ABX1H1I4_9ACTN|nr:DUF6344 domain-containing protein [Streptomyces physcomitrii]NKI41089.1 hypothetical protein [Streptomyces physcomitrii]
MAATKVMKLWAALIAAVFTVFAALGFSSTATAAVPAQKTKEHCNDLETALDVMDVTPAHFVAKDIRSLPPTMKQRIAAEAHGSSPSCRRMGSTADRHTPRHEQAVPAEDGRPPLNTAEAPVGTGERTPLQDGSAFALETPDFTLGDPQAPAPRGESAPAPESESAPAPQSEEASAQQNEEAPAPQGEEAPLMGEEAPAMEDAEGPAPDTAEAPAPESAEEAAPEPAFPSQRQGTGEARPSGSTGSVAGALSPTIVHQTRPNVYEDSTAALLAGPSGQILS